MEYVLEVVGGGFTIRKPSRRKAERMMAVYGPI
jgi:hypothetical protein